MFFVSKKTRTLRTLITLLDEVTRDLLETPRFYVLSYGSTLRGRFTVGTGTLGERG